MSTVYSFSGFARVLIKNGITFSIRDFLDPKKVDKLIEKLIKKTCDECTYAGAGIARSCFIDYKGDSAIKVYKDFYTDFSDEDAREEYCSYCYYSEDEVQYVDGGWAFNLLHEAVKSTRACCHQNYVEISSYEDMLEDNSLYLDYVPRIYAVSSNWQVEIMECCDGFEYSYYENIDRRDFI